MSFKLSSTAVVLYWPLQ